MTLTQAQRDLALANVGGAPGVLVSGVVWLVAGAVWMRAGVAAGFAALFVGGMLIVPIALLIARVARAPQLGKGNPLERLGLEATVVLFAGLAVAYALLDAAPGLVFPVMALTIGARYFSFRTLYGDPLYWLLGGLLAAAGTLALFAAVAWPGNVAVVVGGVEVALAAILFVRHRATSRVAVR